MDVMLRLNILSLDIKLSETFDDDASDWIGIAVVVDVE
jgi:hypothetical protein